MDKLTNEDIVIIPDIHNKWFEAEEILDKEGDSNVIFLGDYFDDFDDTLETTYQTAEWLKKSMTNPNRVHLLGNHDLSYIDERYRCSGFSEGKMFAIRNAGVDLTKLQHYCWAGDWLCTHAGLTRDFFSAFNHKNLYIHEFLDDMVDNYTNRLYNCSASRGGRDAHSGIVWCDYNEFEPIPNVKQIFGHTHGDVRLKDDNNICIDTWLEYYAVYSDGKMTIKEV